MIDSDHPHATDRRTISFQQLVDRDIIERVGKFGLPKGRNQSQELVVDKLKHGMSNHPSQTDTARPKDSLTRIAQAGLPSHSEVQQALRMSGCTVLSHLTPINLFPLSVK